MLPRMSRQTALRNVRLLDCDRWGHTEYSLNYHKRYIGDLTGLDPTSVQARRAFHAHFEIDLLWRTHNGLFQDWDLRGRTTDMGHASYEADGSDQRRPTECPFKTAEEVWAFDPVAEYGLPDFDEQVDAYDALDRQAREDFPEQLTTGGYYRTLVSGAIAVFGWEMLLLGLSRPDRMERVFDGFFRYTLHHMQAWAKTSAEVMIQHDDFVWTSGPFVSPELYRKVLIPRYAELWKPLHAAGKKVLFCSDGDFTMFVADLAEAGADGFIFEPLVDFGYMARNFGRSHCLVGSFVDCRDLTFGHREAVRQAIRRTAEALRTCRGAILAVGNHLPANIPSSMMDRYMEALRPLLNR
jgi:hypothetical protein